MTLLKPPIQVAKVTSDQSMPAGATPGTKRDGATFDARSYTIKTLWSPRSFLSSSFASLHGRAEAGGPLQRSTGLCLHVGGGIRKLHKPCLRPGTKRHKLVEGAPGSRGSTAGL